MATLLTQTYNLNLIPGQNIVVVNVAAYDNSPRLIRFNMFNGAVAADVSGWSARVEGTRQGTKVGFSTVCTVASPVVSFAITNAMTASSGKHQAAVVFYQGEERVASATFILNVAPAVLDESTPATEEDTTIYQQWLAANTSQIQTNANEIAVLKGRMDEFASLPPGSTEGNAELVDIRIGYNGQTYPTAGDAVRGQVSDLKTAIEYYHKIYGMKSFSINAGSSHSSNSDRLNVNMQAGKRYAITMFTDNPTAQACQGYVMYEGASSTTAVSATNITASTTPKTIFYTPSQNVTSIGYFVGSASVKRNVWFYVYDPDEIDFRENTDRLLEQSGMLLLGKNLLGTEEKRYPVYIPGNATLTWHFSDNSVITAGAAGGSLHFYNDDGIQLVSYALSATSGKTSRTVTLNASEPVRYISLDKYYETPLQVEFGDVVTDFAEHVKSPLETDEDLKKLLSADGVYSTEVTVAAGSSHISLSNRLQFHVEEGEDYYLYIECNNPNVSYIDPYEYEINRSTTSGSKGRHNINTFRKYTSAIDCYSLGFYKNAVPTEYTIKMYAFKADTLSAILLDNINSIKDAANMFTSLGIDQPQYFTVNAGATHSSLYSQISVEPTVGDVLYFYIAGKGHSESSLIVYDENDNAITNGLGYINKNGDFHYYCVLSEGIKKVGMYLDATDEVRNVIFALVKNEHVVKSLSKDNRDIEFLPKLLNAKRKANGGNYNNLTSPEIFTLAHFSDIHANAGALRRVQYFKDKYAGYLNDTICTGDMVQDKISDGMGFWNTNSDGSILMCIGNHDSLGSDGWANPVSQQTLYDTYISPYAEHWNAEIVSGKAYWYKDYTEQKIRLIAVDATVFDPNEQTAQITWLTNALTGAKTEGYSVVGAVHFPPYSTRFQKIDCNFCALMHGAIDMSQFAWRTYHVAIQDAVQAFIDGGGDFVCWLSGHTHYSLVSYDTNYPKQLFITNTCAMPVSTYDEADRSLPEDLDAINVVCVDTVRKFIKLLRYGYEWDDAMRHIGTCVLRYGGSVPEVVYQN